MRRYHVIDGKQRLLSLLEFLDDEFPLSKKYSPETPGKFFSELDSSVQKTFYSYFLPFEFFTEISDEQVVEIFDRFNRDVQRLNDQELRHARYGGAFITSMEQLADDPFWRDLNFFTLADTRRMKDVEYASIIFVLTMHGIQDGDPLDFFYAEYDEAIPEVGKYTDRYNVVKSMILEMQVVATNIYLDNLSDQQVFDEVYVQYFGNVLPAATTIQQIGPTERKPDKDDHYPGLEQVSLIAVRKQSSH